MASALLTSQPGRAFPFRCSAALPSALSLLWAGHLGWAAAAPRPAQLLSLVGDLSPLSRAVLLTDTIHHHVAVAAIGLWVSLGGAFGLAAGRSWLNSTPSGRGQLKVLPLGWLLGSPGFSNRCFSCVQSTEKGSQRHFALR